MISCHHNSIDSPISFPKPRQSIVIRYSMIAQQTQTTGNIAGHHDLKLNSLNGYNQQIWLLPYQSYCILALSQQYMMFIRWQLIFIDSGRISTHICFTYIFSCTGVTWKLCFFCTNLFIFILRHNFTAISSTTRQKFPWRYKMDCFNEQKQKCCFSGYCFHSSPYESSQRYSMATFLLSIHVSYWGTQLHYIHTVVGWCSTQTHQTLLQT